MTELERLAEEHAFAEKSLGEGAWFLIRSYGRFTSGPNSGSYVGGLPSAERLEVLRALASGSTLDIHLTHCHQSGNYETSRLRLSEGRLIMVYRDREVAA
jgi:hypothetical protein